MSIRAGTNFDIRGWTSSSKAVIRASYDTWSNYITRSKHRIWGFRCRGKWHISNLAIEKTLIVFLGPRSEDWGPDSSLVCGRFTTTRLWKCRSMQIWHLKKNKPKLSLKRPWGSRQVDVWAHLRAYLWSVSVVLFRYAVGVVTKRTRVSQRTGMRGPQILKCT
jgi:hypothetical protein